MSVLTGPEIRKALADCVIQITPCDDEQIAQCSVDLHLHPTLLVYRHDRVERRRRYIDHPAFDGFGTTESVLLPLDLAKPCDTEALVIPPQGLVLRPGVLYLGATIERLHAPRHAAIVAGKSSPARKGLRVEAAGLVEPGFDDQVTLEIEVAGPLVVYPGWPVAQVRFETVVGEVEPYAKRGHYANGQAQGPVASRSHLHRPRHVDAEGRLIAR